MQVWLSGVAFSTWGVLRHGAEWLPQLQLVNILTDPCIGVREEDALSLLSSFTPSGPALRGKP
eukprot:4539221-Amphidinium_carterae.3